MSSVPPGWYPDGSPENSVRYWDGRDWTQYTSNEPPGNIAPNNMVFNNGLFNNRVTSNRLITLTPEQSRKALPIVAMVTGGVLIVFGLIGWGFTSLTTTLFDGFNDPPEGSVETKALVVDIVFDSEGHCSPVLEFTDEGDPVRVTAPLRATPCQWAKGETVVAYYVPGRLQQTGTTRFTTDVDSTSGSVMAAANLINPALIVGGCVVLVLGLWRRVVNSERSVGN